jgi:hypothetical protein
MRFYVIVVLFAYACLLPGFQACKNTKQQTWSCLKRFDSNGNKKVEKEEIQRVVSANMYWYEKLIYPSEKIVKLFEDDCGLPLIESHMKKDTCFKSCFYRDSIVSRLC